MKHEVYQDYIIEWPNEFNIAMPGYFYNKSNPDNILGKFAIRALNDGGITISDVIGQIPFIIEDMPFKIMSFFNRDFRSQLNDIGRPYFINKMAKVLLSKEFIVDNEPEDIQIGLIEKELDRLFTATEGLDLKNTDADKVFEIFKGVSSYNYDRTPHFLYWLHELCETVKSRGYYQ